MIDAAIVPDGHVVGLLPPEPDLQVMVLDDQLHEPVQKMLGFLIRQAMDPFHVVADGKDGFPARHRVSANNRMDRLEDLADVLGGAARGRVDGEVVALGGVAEQWLGVVGCQGVEELAEGRRDAVVEFVA